MNILLNLIHQNGQDLLEVELEQLEQSFPISLRRWCKEVKETKGWQKKNITIYIDLIKIYNLLDKLKNNIDNFYLEKWIKSLTFL